MSSSIPASTLEKFTTFGDLLRFLRRRAGITQMELATAVGYSDAQISRLEQNLRLPDIPTIEARFVPALSLEEEPKVVARLLDLAANVRREDAPGLGLCPYKGLNYFDEVDADLFVGREELTAKITERVLSLTSSLLPDEMRFLAIVGASGSGKSSLVRAGLVPSLRWNKISADWNINILTPGAHPLESLAMALSGESGSVAAAATLMDDLARDPRSLHLFARREMNALNGSRWLLVVDQFEETFALCRSEEERVSFIGSLLTAASEADGPVIVVITLRADFYAHCAGYIQLREALSRQQEYIGAMTDRELRRAIEEPARRGRWEIEPGLVDLLLHDVGHEPGALPLLSHALLETWQRRRGRLMTLSGYASSGGVRGAIAETAEAVFSDQFTQEQRAIARRIFLRLTELGDETATGDTRRRATFNELILKPEDATTTHNVLKALADARLIITTENSAEVAHEALIREWPTLRSWLEDNREGLRLHRHLTDAAQEWVTRNREPDVLYRGARLSQAREWAASHRDEMNPLEHEFLEASLELAEREANEKEAQRQRELEAARKLAEAEGRRAEEQTLATRQLRKRSLYFAGAFIVALVMALAAGLLGWQARTAGRLAASRELAAASISNLDVDPERSILLALEAVSTAYTLEAEDALHQSIAASRVQMTIPAFEPGTPLSVAFSPTGKHLATASQDGIVKILDAYTGDTLLILSGHYATYSPDGKRLATVLADGTVKFWDAETGAEISLAGQIDAGDNVVFSPDGSRLATVAGENLPRIWDVNTGKELINFPGHTDYVSYVFFSPDGHRLLTSSDDGTARIWNATTGKELLRLSGHPSWVWTAAFSPDGKRIATVSENEAMIWDAATGEKLSTLTGHMNTIYVVTFSPDGKWLATGSQDRKIKVWDAATGTELFTLSGHTGAVTGLAFSPECANPPGATAERCGTRLATGSDDGTLKLWSLAPSHELLTLPANPINQVAFSPECTRPPEATTERCGARLAGAGRAKATIWDSVTGKGLQSLVDQDNLVSTLGFSPDGKLLATAGDDLHMEIWDVASGVKLYEWPAHTGLANALVFSPDGTLLATGSDDYKVKAWDVSTLASTSATPARVVLTLELPAEVKSLAFSPNGKRLAIGVNNGTAKVRDFVTGEELLTLRGHTDAVVSVAFSPSGKSLATASLDGTVKVWDANTGREIFTLSGHNNAVTSVAFSPNGKRIATASRDGTAKLWDAETGQELLTFFGDGSGLNSIAFSPDGERLATGGDAGVREYLLDMNDLVALARTRVTRSLTSEECQKYLHRVSGSCAPPVSIPTTTPLPPATNGWICQIASGGGLYDNYFNALMYKGLQDSASIYGWEAAALESESISNLEENMRTLLDADCKLIVAPVALFEATQSAAEANPDQKFMMMDFVYDPPLDNIWNQVYATDQAAFLAGYTAASVTKTGKVGVFGGIDILQVTDFMDGFALGVEYYNQKNGTSVEVLGWNVDKHEGLFTGGFCCSTEGRTIALQLLDEGADIILPVAGQSVGWGALAEVQEFGNAWFIGVDTDWTVTDPKFADIILTSIEKRFDVSVVRAAKSIKDGTFTGGIHVGTLETGEVGLSPFHQLDALISDNVKADLEQIKADIISGKVQTKP
jgi:WD40 repeat protein/basic membrane lipoprotein Med (substrate-binding protein (PBP1-ABC) superfamily)/transcriptional regulator with XRE-family HTH domain